MYLDYSLIRVASNSLWITNDLVLDTDGHANSSLIELFMLCYDTYAFSSFWITNDLIFSHYMD